MKNDRDDGNWECETDFSGFVKDVRTGFKELPSQVVASLRETFDTLLGTRSDDGKDKAE